MVVKDVDELGASEGPADVKRLVEVFLPHQSAIQKEAAGAPGLPP